MATQSRIEAGVELIARLSEKTSLRRLDEKMFQRGLRNTDVVEIIGDVSVGKTCLLSRMLAKCILPTCYRNIPLEGCGASAVLINNDHHFQSTKLVERMTGIVTEICLDKIPKTFAINMDAINLVVRDYLKNLHVIDCYDSEQFLLTLSTLDDVFLNKADIALLAIDSITAYYWEDRENETATSVDSYVEKILKIIRKHTSRFNVVTMYTRVQNADVIRRRCCKERMTRGVNYRIDLHNIDRTLEFEYTLKTM